MILKFWNSETCIYGRISRKGAPKFPKFILGNHSIIGPLTLQWAASPHKKPKDFRVEITTTGCMGSDVEAALQQGHKVCSNANTQVFLISIPKTLSFGRVLLVDQLEGIFPHRKSMEIHPQNAQTSQIKVTSFDHLTVLQLHNDPEDLEVPYTPQVLKNVATRITQQNVVFFTVQSCKTASQMSRWHVKLR